MSSYLNNLLSRSFKQTEVIRPRLPSRFEPITTPGIPASGQRYSAQDRIENQVMNSAGLGFNSKEFLNKPEKGIDHSTGLSRLSEPSEFSEKQKNLLEESSWLGFTGLDASRLDQAFSENIVPFFSRPGNIGMNRREKVLLNIKSPEESLQSADRQVFNRNTTEQEHEKKPYVEQLERLDPVQQAF